MLIVGWGEQTTSITRCCPIMNTEGILAVEAILVAFWGVIVAIILGTPSVDSSQRIAYIVISGIIALVIGALLWIALKEQNRDERPREPAPSDDLPPGAGEDTTPGAEHWE